MAVPRTHDGSVGPRSHSGSPVLPILSAVLAVVIVACLGVLGVRYSGTEGSFGDRVRQVFSGDDADAEQADAAADDPRARELVLSQANQFIIRINTYGPSDLDEQDKMPDYVQQVRDVITPKLAVDFDKQVTYAEQSVAQAGVARTVQLYATGLSSMDADLATVLVTGAISQSYPDPAKEGRVEVEPLLFRYEVRLVKTDGTWLVDDFTPVRGEVEGEPSPGVPADPDAPASGDPSAAPSASPSSAIVQRYSEIVSKREVAIVAAIDALDTCGFPAAAEAGCGGAPGDLGQAVQGLANSLQGASNPDAKVFVGVPPAAISALVTNAQDSSGGVLDAVAALDAECVSGTSQQCATQRDALVQAVNTLVADLREWRSVG